MPRPATPTSFQAPSYEPPASLRTSPYEPPASLPPLPYQAPASLRTPSYEPPASLQLPPYAAPAAPYEAPAALPSPAYERPGQGGYSPLPSYAPQPSTEDYVGRRRAPEPTAPPMADYLTRPPIAPPVAPPARRATPPIPSAARSRKAPKEPPARPPENKAGRLRVRVNPITCAGHGICAELLPELISLDEWNYPSPIVTEVPAELENHAQRAAQQCPTLAIVLERRHPKPKP
jgi:ferredoxin